MSSTAPTKSVQIVDVGGSLGWVTPFLNDDRPSCLADVSLELPLGIGIVLDLASGDLRSLNAPERPRSGAVTIHGDAGIASLNPDAAPHVWAAAWIYFTAFGETPGQALPEDARAVAAVELLVHLSLAAVKGDDEAWRDLRAIYREQFALAATVAKPGFGKRVGGHEWVESVVFAAEYVLTPPSAVPALLDRFVQETAPPKVPELEPSGWGPGRGTKIPMLGDDNEVSDGGWRFEISRRDGAEYLKLLGTPTDGSDEDVDAVVVLLSSSDGDGSTFWENGRAACALIAPPIVQQDGALEGAVVDSNHRSTCRVVEVRTELDVDDSERELRARYAGLNLLVRRVEPGCGLTHVWSYLDFLIGQGRFSAAVEMADAIDRGFVRLPGLWAFRSVVGSDYGNAIDPQSDYWTALPSIRFPHLLPELADTGLEF